MSQSIVKKCDRIEIDFKLNLVLTHASREWAATAAKAMVATIGMVVMNVEKQAM